MKNKHILPAVFFILFSASLIAQNKIGDNPTVTSSGSLLELESLTKGFRLPRVVLNDIAAWTLDGSPVSGMVIFNENGTVPKGLYYWSTDAAKWIKVIGNLIGTTPPTGTAAGGTTYYNTTTGDLSYYDAVTNSWVSLTTLAGDVMGTTSASVVSKINGSPLGTTTRASSGNVLAWNGTAWAPAASTGITSSTTAPTSPTAGQTYYNTTDNKLYYYDGTSWNTVATATSGTTSPSSPVVGQTYYNTADSKFYYYNGTAWVAIDSTTSGSSTPTGTAAGGTIYYNTTTGDLSYYDAVTNSWVSLTTLAGDVTGTTSASVVSKINGSPLGTTTGAASGNVLAWNGTAWAPAASTGITSSATAPTSPTAGQTYYNTTDNKLYYYDGTSWNTVATATSSTTPPTSPTVGQTYYNTTDSKFYYYNGTAWVAIDSTLSGTTSPSGTASGGTTYYNSTTGDLSYYDAVTNSWVSLTTLAGDVTGTTSASVVSKINGSPLGTTTGAANGNVLAWNGTAWAPAAVAPATVSNTVASGNVSTTVNGTTGTAVAITHTLSSATNTLSSAIAGGTAQTATIINSNVLSQNGANQLVSTVNGIASTALTANVAGDVAGTLGASTVSKLQGGTLTITTPTSGNLLQYNGSAWVNVTPGTVITMGAPNAASTANGGTLSAAGVLQLSPADGTNPGLVTTGTQTFAGIKTFSAAPVVTPFSTAGVVHNNASGTLSSSTIVDADVSATAAIAGTKVSPNFGTQNITTTGTASASTVTGTTGFVAGTGTGTTAGTVVLNDGTAGTSNTVTLQAPASVTTTYSLTLPAAQGAAGTTLSNDGSGKLSWTSATAGSGWGLTGNAGTTAGTNFMGTTDDVDVVFKRNNVKAGLLTDASQNTSWGVNALSNNTTGAANTAIGYASLTSNTTGYSNIGIGLWSLESNIDGYRNIAVGAQSLDNFTSGKENVAIGFLSLQILATGDGNTALGQRAGQNQTSGNNNIMIGPGQDVANTSGSNQLNIGGAIFGLGLTGSRTAPAGNIGIGTTAPGSKLEVNGAATNSAPAAGTTATIDFGVNNLAYTSYAAASPAFTLNNMLNGGAYTLLLTGTTNSGTALFTASGFTVKYMGTTTMTSGKTHIYSFIVAGNSVFVTMATEN